MIVSDLFNDKYTGKTTGGFVVYYVSGSKGDVTAFKPVSKSLKSARYPRDSQERSKPPMQGFRMLVGDAANRVSKNRKSQTCFRCYTGPNFGGDNAAPCQDAKRVSRSCLRYLLLTSRRLDTEGFPTTPCPGGIRSNILYPT